jgi:hypothetical protein
MIAWNIKVTLTSRIQFLVEEEITPCVTTLGPTAVPHPVNTSAVSSRLKIHGYLPPLPMHAFV